jgi:hypothetical protein
MSNVVGLPIDVLEKFADLHKLLAAQDHAARALVEALERPTSFQRRRGDVVEDCEGLSIAEQHDKEIGDLIEALKEALK